MWHWKDGKLVKVNDDLISAMCYGLMMLRFASMRRDFPCTAPPDHPAGLTHRVRNQPHLGRSPRETRRAGDRRGGAR